MRTWLRKIEMFVIAALVGGGGLMTLFETVRLILKAGDAVPV